MNTFTVEALGQGIANAGGAPARTRRFEVLDRMARIGVGLSPSQNNYWVWFRESWDDARVASHANTWGTVFVGWMKNVLDCFHNGKSNAFSVFVHDESCRVFHGSAVSHVP